MKTAIRSTAAALCLAALSPIAAASPDAWAEAEAEYEAHHYAQALELYVRMAEAGDARAAEIAGCMLSMGEKLYGDSVRRDDARAARLLAIATSAEDRPVALYLLRRTKLPAL